LPGELRRREATRVRTIHLAQREMVRTLSTATTVESQAEIEVFPRSAGVVVELLVEEGDAVEAAQVLARLDDRTARAARTEAEVALREAREAKPRQALMKEETFERYQRAKLTYESAMRDYERNAQAGLISAQDLDRLALTRDTAMRDQEAARLANEVSAQDEAAAETAIERAQLLVEKADLDLTFTEIRAPFTGLIARRDIRVGDSVSSAAPAFVLTDPEHLRAIFHRPQRELPLFRSAVPTWNGDATEGESQDHRGIEIRVTSEAIPGAEFVGRIRLVSPTIDVASGSFRITVDLLHPETGPRLLPGMLVRLEVVTDRHADALVVPKRALVREGESNYVFIVDAERRAQRIGVIEGYSDKDEVEVIPRREGELVVGTEVIVVGNRDLEDDELVQSEAWQVPAVDLDAEDEVATDETDTALTSGETTDPGESGSSADSGNGSASE
jgi:membrane fusion protein (multidrug efflux system)